MWFKLLPTIIYADSDTQEMPASDTIKLHFQKAFHTLVPLHQPRTRTKANT